MRWRGSKYRAVPTVIGTARFASKLEARRYEQLQLLVQAGKVLWFIRQPRFDLPGGVRYVADFLVVEGGVTENLLLHGDGTQSREWVRTVVVEDCKGVETPAFKIKRRLMAESYPKVQLRILTSKDIR